MLLNRRLAHLYGPTVALRTASLTVHRLASMPSPPPLVSSLSRLSSQPRPLPARTDYRTFLSPPAYPYARFFASSEADPDANRDDKVEESKDFLAGIPAKEHFHEGDKVWDMWVDEAGVCVRATPTISLNAAMAKYKLWREHLDSVPRTIKWCKPKLGEERKVSRYIYDENEVKKRAFEAHGGRRGHEAFVRRCQMAEDCSVDKFEAKEEKSWLSRWWKPRT
ncbi:hypothetical protein JCM8097_007246 [Rhodosporidiobolus ruineniae]